jgi:hypothetical protein
MQITYLVPGKLSEGDVKVLKSGERFIRKQGRAYDGRGNCLGRVVAHGKPSFDWIRETSPSQKIIDTAAGRDAVMDVFLNGNR